MADELVIETVESGAETLILRLQGHLDARGAAILMERTMAARANGRRLILNLSGISFIASSGIGALLALVEDSAEEKRGVALVALSEEVRSVLELLNLDQFFTIHPGEAEGLAARAA